MRRVRVLSGLLLIAAALGVRAQSTLPIPGVAGMPAVPQAKGTPDPAVTYKFVFDLSATTTGPDTVHPGLIAVARLINTFAGYGVDAAHRQFVLVFHDETSEFALKDDTYRQRHGGHGNPNAAMLRALSEAGVQFRVGGESVLARHIDPATIAPDVELDLSTPLTFLDLERQGYVFSSTGKL